MEKQDLRRTMLVKRQQYSVSNQQRDSEAIYQQLKKIPRFCNSKEILCYVSYRQEVNTKIIIEQTILQEKKIATPRIDSQGIMNFYYINGLDDLISGQYGILEPRKQCLRAKGSKDAVILIPGVAFDEKLQRIGYGGGYYDRYLEDKPFLYKIGLAYPFQIVDQLKIEKHDIPLDALVTDDRVIFGINKNN